MQPADDVTPQRGISRSEVKRVVLIAAALFAVGLAITPNFGQGTDEFSNYQYAADALRAYAGTRTFVGPFYNGLPIDWLYGPFHLETAYLLGKVVTRLPLGWTATDGRHLANFIVFLMGGVGLYFLARRMMRPFAAGVAGSLFVSQPLFWGQSFTNQKDIPFLAYFILSIALGLAAVDRIHPRTFEHPEANGSDRKDPGWLGPLSNDTSGLRSWQRVLLVAGIACLVLGLAAALSGTVFLPIAHSTVEVAYMGRAPTFLQMAFDRVATDVSKTPLSLYLDKLDLVYAWLKIPLALGWLALLLWLVRARLPSTWAKIASTFPEGLGLLIVAGAVLGLADSVRVAAPLAGALVALYLFVKLRRGAWLPLGLYALVALSVTYLTWPWLWQSPVQSYWESIRVMSNFPAHRVLFDGVVYASSDIPRFYVPKLIAIQTTGILLPMAFLGLGVLIWRARRRQGSPLEPTLWLLWLLVPVGLVIGLRTPLYGNLRQMYFALPPLFLLAGIAVESATIRIKGTAWGTLAVGAVLVPGVAATVILHPYSGSYFNLWVGWTSEAYGKFQVDSWCTSYREAMSFVNGHALQGAVVDVRGPFQSAADFARSDLEMHPDYAPAEAPDYAIMCQVDMLGDGYHGELPIIYEVRRGQAVLAVVRGKP